VPGINNDVIIDNGHTITFQSFLDDAKMKNLTVRPSGTISSLGTITTGEDLINYGIINLLFSNPLNINRDLYNYGTINISTPMGIAITHSLFNDGSIIGSGGGTNPSSLLQISGPQLVNNGVLQVFQIWMYGTSMELSGSGSITIGNNVMISTVAGASITIATGGTINLNKITWSSAGCKVFLGNTNLEVSSLVSFSSTNYIVTNGTGKLIISGTNTPKTFPIGSVTSYTPVTISGGNTGTHNFGARVSNSFSYPPADNAIVNREWLVEDLTGGANVNLSFQWNSSDETGSFNRASCAIGRYNGTDWSAITSFTSASGTNPYSSATNGVASFGLFFIGSSSSFGRIASAQSGNWSSPGTWIGGIVPSLSDNVAISPGHTVVVDPVAATVSALVVNNTASLELNSGSTLIANSSIYNTGNILIANSASLRTGGDFTNTGTLGSASGALNTILSVGGNINNNAGNLSARSLYLSNINLGSNNVAQLVNSASPLNGFGTIELWNTGPAITFNCPVNCSTLIFNGNSGNLVLTSNNLNITTAITGYSENKYIQLNGSGQLQLNGTASPKFFPIGTATSYTPLVISNGNVATETFSVGLSNTFSHLPFNNAVVQREWNINNTSGGANVDLTFQWNAIDENPLFTRNLSYVGHYTNGAWAGISTLSAAMGSNPFTKTVSGVNSFSPFAIGSSGALPMTWVYFNGTGCNGKTCLEWATSNELNTDKFVVERSINNQSYIAVDSIAANNLAGIHTYHYTDDFTAPVLYYRIRQKDIDGRYSFSRTVKIENAISPIITILPNPMKDKIIIKNADGFEYIQFVDIIGRVAKQSNLNPNNNSFNISALQRGIYFVKFISASKQFVIKVLKE